nr:hypothetical protein [uncultured Albidiferax sp.]
MAKTALHTSRGQRRVQHHPAGLPPAHTDEPAESPSQHTLQVCGNASTGYTASLVIGITSG